METDLIDHFNTWFVSKNPPLKISVYAHVVMWMQQGRICILGKIEFSIDNENAGKKAQVKLYFMPELKVIIYLWKK